MKMDQMKWQVTPVSETVLAKGSKLTFVAEQFDLPNGVRAQQETVRHPGAVVILPIDVDESVYFVHQYRHSIRQAILELPAGTLGAQEDPLRCAQRELQEELKLSAGRWISLGVLYPAPGFCDERLHAFAALELTPSSGQLDIDELLESKRLDRPQLLTAIQDLTLIDAKTLALLLRAKMHGLLNI